MAYVPDVRGLRIPVEPVYPGGATPRPLSPLLVGPAMALIQSGQELREVERQLQRIRAATERALAASRVLDPSHAPLVSEIATALQEAQRAESRLQSTRALVESSMGLPTGAEFAPPAWAPAAVAVAPAPPAAEWAVAAPGVAREPPIEIRDTGRELVAHIELPGVSRDDVEVQVRDVSLYVRAEREREEAEAEQIVASERLANRFVRRIWLPEHVVPGKASATFKDGVLEVTLPKKHPGEPAQRVSIK